MSKVGPKLHFLATCIVAAGTLVSAFWILSVNSWMQTPAGYSIAADGRMMPEHWLSVIFNPSFFVRFPHMVLACYLAVAFVVGGTGAFQLLRDDRNQASRMMFSMAMWMAAIVAPAQILMGDAHGLNTLLWQPAKIAAMEGHYDSGAGKGLILFGIPNEAQERIDYEIQIPHLSALILTHEWNGMLRGLKEWAPQDRPPVAIVFWSFRIMVGLGSLMALIGLTSLWLRWKRRLYQTRLMLWATLAMGPAGIIAVLAGWVTTEVGRQPYTVYGVLRTAQSLSPIGAPGVAISLLAFVVVYLSVFGAGVLLMLRLMAKAPISGEPGPTPHLPARAAGITPGPAMAAE